MKLNEPLKTSFEFEGKTFEIDCSFDVVLDVFEMFDDDVLNDVEKLQLAIEIMTGEIQKSHLKSGNTLMSILSPLKKTLLSMIGKGILCQL